MLLSFKPYVYEKLLSGIKIYEHRKVFPDEPIKAFLYVSHPVSSITGILYLGKRHSLEQWKDQYAYDEDAVHRIDDYLKTQRYAMEIEEFRETNRISLHKLRNDLEKFVVPQMYYYLDGTELLYYIQKELIETGTVIKHDFSNISSIDICKN